MRLDLFLVEKGHFESRARAQAAVKAGLVRIDGAPAMRPAASVAPGALVEVTGEACPYVSRGGLKLAAALAAFEIDPDGAVCLDLGASTGGFTDVLLRAGARKVYAVDVGTGQLHASLAADARVVDLQQTHAKALSRALVPDPVELLVCDASFIGLQKVLPPAMALCADRAGLVALVKPQFELGRAALGKGGIVRAPHIDIEAMLDGMKDWLEGEGWAVRGVIDSPVAGGDGNREHLIAATR